MKTVLLISAALLLLLSGCSNQRTSVAVYVEGLIPNPYMPFPAVVRAEYRMEGQFAPPVRRAEAQQ